MKKGKEILKRMLNGSLSQQQAAAALRRELRPYPALIKWSEDCYSFWPEKGRMTEEQVKQELHTDNIDDIVMITFK